jgi:PilZ domain
MKKGRTERRMDVIMAGRLSSAGSVQHTEWVSIRNISGHGAQVTCDQRWEVHDLVSLGETVGDHHLDAEVVYCHPTADNRYSVGLKFSTVAHMYGGVAPVPYQTESLAEANAR